MVNNCDNYHDYHNCNNYHNYDNYYNYDNHNYVSEEITGEGTQGSLPAVTSSEIDNNSSWISYEDFISSFKYVILLFAIYFIPSTLVFYMYSIILLCLVIVKCAKI